MGDGEAASGVLLLGEEDRVERRELTAEVVGAAEGGRRAETSWSMMGWMLRRFAWE